MKDYLIAVLFLIFSSFTYAGTGSGKVSKIMVHEKSNGLGVIMFLVEKHENRPKCAVYGWAFDANTDLGKAMYAMLLSAAAQGKPVNVYGTNDCVAWGDRERPFWISVDY